MGASSSKRKLTLTTQIMLGMALGLVVGILIFFLPDGAKAWSQTYLVEGVFTFGGKAFIALLKLMVVPLVIVSLVCGTASIEDTAKLGRVGIRTFVMYLGTTAVAVALSLIVANLINPGVGIQLPGIDRPDFNAAPPSVLNMLLGLFPSNVFKAMAEANMLQLIFFSGLFGLSLSLAGKPAKPIYDLFVALNEVIMKMVLVILTIAPIGVFCLIAKVFAAQGMQAILPLLKYMGTLVCVLLLHAAFTYTLLVKFVAKINPLRFFNQARQPAAFAFSTSSSGATIPVTLETLERKMGVHNSIASFTVPLGATVNMDGTAIMQGVATVFVAQTYGIDLSMSQYLMVILLATLASVGTATVPSAGLIMLTMVFQQVGLPLEAIGVLFAVDRIPDMTRTAVNVVGDCAVTCAIARMEGQLDDAQFAGIQTTETGLTPTEDPPTA